jgi:hypothetical protein
LAPIGGVHKIRNVPIKRITKGERWIYSGFSKKTGLRMSAAIIRPCSRVKRRTGWYLEWKAQKPRTSLCVTKKGGGIFSWSSDMRKS